MFMRFRGGGVGHTATREATNYFLDDRHTLDHQLKANVEGTEVMAQHKAEGDEESDQTSDEEDVDQDSDKEDGDAQKVPEDAEEGSESEGGESQTDDEDSESQAEDEEGEDDLGAEDGEESEDEFDELGFAPM
ncbi:hypothetical protein BKA70DRAFT_1223184 [Coprinopsis sp. MPI-PUGE-AT-0042]|nr:hypothetical protein BKA70DRAFT_1223184 [Coprinopsis sp. MPI-PUGE-AT-0042]